MIYSHLINYCSTNFHYMHWIRCCTALFHIYDCKRRVLLHVFSYLAKLKVTCSACVLRYGQKRSYLWWEVCMSRQRWFSLWEESELNPVVWLVSYPSLSEFLYIQIPLVPCDRYCTQWSVVCEPWYDNEPFWVSPLLTVSYLIYDDFRLQRAKFWPPFVSKNGGFPWH